MANISISRGNTYSWTLTFKETDGTAQDITGDTVYFTVKENITDTYANAKIKKVITSHTSPTTGVTTLTLTKTDTNLTPQAYEFDFLRKTAGGSERTRGRGQFVVEPNTSHDYS